MSVSTKSFLAGLALVPLLGAVSLANAGSLTINGESCGTFTQATISQTGNIILTGVSNCNIGGGTGGGDTGGGDTGGGDTGGGDTGGGDTGGGDTGGGDTGGGDTGGGDTGGGDTGGGDTGGGGTPTGQEGVVNTAHGPVYIQNLPLAGGIPNTVASASGLANGVQYNTYAFRFTTGSNVKGMFRTVRYDGSSANRALSIHTEPGNMNSMGSGCYLRASRDATRSWSTTSACKLNPNTTYYLNVQGTVLCTTSNVASCRFTLSGSAE